jgi:hypothetical protein
MWGTELNKVVALAVDEAKAQIYSNDKITAKDVGIKNALDEINAIFQESFGIKDKALSRVKDGSIVIDRLIGTTDDKGIEYTMNNVSRFLGAVDSKLGTTFANGKTVFGNLGIGRQDVYDWENGIGLIDESNAGLVKYGRKEVDMIATRANQVLGNGSSVVGWLNEHLRVASEAQNPDIRRIGAGLIRTAVEDKYLTPDKGDVVIRTTGRAFGADDPTGRNTGRITQNGVREISMHAINDTPRITAKDTLLVAEDYAGSIVDFGRAEGTFADTMSFSQAIERNGGTALLEMPDDTFAKKYVRLVDFGDITKGGTADTPVLREVQKLQQQIWRNIKEYQNIGSHDDPDPERIEKVRGRIDNLVTEYDDKVARMVTNARDDGIMKTFGSAKMDMAGRYRIQGTNPLANYEQTSDGKWQQKANAKYQEGMLYVSKGRFLEMIDGAETQIADALGIDKVGKVTVADLAKSDIKALQSEIVQQMLDPNNNKGLYGFVNRYPTIKQSTIQAMGIAIDDTMDDADRGARLAAGTAYNLKADYDGDFLSAVLTHYKSKDASVIHDELKVMQRYEAEAGRIAGSKVVADIHSDMQNVAKEMNITVGELVKQNPGMADEMIQTKLNSIDALETREARLGKSFVGIIDNTRDKTLGLATAVIDTLERTQGADGKSLISSIRANTYRNVIEEATAKFSQDLISSKKFSVAAEVERLRKSSQGLGDTELRTQAQQIIDERHVKVDEMNQYLLNLTDENRDKFVAHNAEIGLFDASKKSDMVQMNAALDMIQDVQRWTAGSRGSRNKSLSIGISEGQDSSITRRLMGGNGDMIVPTQAAKTMAELAMSNETTQGMGETMLRSMSNWENSLIQHFNYSSGNADSLIDSMGSRIVDAGDHTLSGATVADDASVKLREVVGKFTPKFSGGGVGGGAIAFGAMWAASALVRSGPTPEGLAEQTQSPAPVAPSRLQTPTARITQNNGEFVNIRVSASNAQNMSEQEIAALVHQEIGAMTSMKMDTTLNVNDNTQNIDQQWLQGVVANAINKGFGF